MRQVEKKGRRRKSDSVSTAKTARRDHRGSPSYGKKATYAGHLGRRCLERLWLFQLVLRLKATIWWVDIALHNALSDV